MLLEGGRWESALASAGVDAREVRGQSMLMALGEVTECLGDMPAAMCHATAALWLSLELVPTYGWR